MSDHNRPLTEHAIFGLWFKWLIAEGALFIPNILSVYLPAMYTPIVCILTAVGLIYLERASSRHFAIACPVLLSVSIRALLVSAFVMILVSMAYSKGWANYFLDPTTVNPAIPYVTSLIISPVVFILAGWAILRDSKYGVCRRCVVQYGPRSERGALGELISREGRYQLIFLWSISLVLTIFSWTYYLVWYVNINMNIPDRFVFGWVPIVLYVVSIFYMGARCFTLWSEIFNDSDEELNAHHSSMSIRVLIVHGNNIFLNRVDDTELSESSLLQALASGKMPGIEFDTPTSFGLPYEKKLANERAKQLIAHNTGLSIDMFNMRYLYTSREQVTGRKTYHYVLTPKHPDMINKAGIPGRWYNLPQFTSLYQNRELTPSLAAEIYRIYTVAMAWKTYDREGRRLYKIKNYRPLFRLEGICDWDVDFNSSHWLNVSRFNEDRPFYRLRRMFNRLSFVNQ